MSLLQTWYNLNYYAIEEQVNDSLSSMRFAALQLYLSDGKEGLVLAVHTTAANVHLKTCLEKVLLRVESRILGGKGYCSASNEALLASQGLLSGIQRKGVWQ